jgi:hypothetical protein
MLVAIYSVQSMFCRFIIHLNCSWIVLDVASDIQVHMCLINLPLTGISSAASGESEVPDDDGTVSLYVL